MSDVLNLYRLQQLDTRLALIDSRQKTIRNALEINAALSDAKARLLAAKSKKEATEIALAQKDSEAQAKRIKIEQIESSLYGGGISNPKELQELQQELSLFKKQLQLLEDQQLDEMQALENANQEFQSATESHRTILSRVEQENSVLVGERVSLEKEAEKLKVERQAAVDSIDSRNLSLYNDISLQRHGIAVTTISDNSCDSCGSVLTPAQKQSAHHSNQIFRCPSCGRIIYS